MKATTFLVVLLVILGGGQPTGSTALFTPVASFRGRLIDPPWSPSRTVMAFMNEDTLWVYDPSRPAEAPIRLLDAGTGLMSGFRWSPDGGWLLCRVQPEGENLISLVAVESTGGPVHWIVRKADIGGFYLWAGDGNIYFWDNTSGHRWQFPAPSLWYWTNPVPQPEATSLVGVRDPTTGHLRTYRFSTVGGLNQEEVTASGLATARYVIPKDTFSDGRFLANVIGGENQGIRVLSSDGDVQSPALPIHGTSVSRDGAWVLGAIEYEVDHDSPPGDLLGGEIFLVRPDGTNLTPVENIPTGIRPFASRQGSYLAYSDPEAGVIHVGTLTLQ